jgi:hypothetical protein
MRIGCRVAACLDARLRGRSDIDRSPAFFIQSHFTRNASPSSASPSLECVAHSCFASSRHRRPDPHHDLFPNSPKCRGVRPRAGRFAEQRIRARADCARCELRSARPAAVERRGRAAVTGRDDGRGMNVICRSINFAVRRASKQRMAFDAYQGRFICQCRFALRTKWQPRLTS